MSDTVTADSQCQPPTCVVGNSDNSNPEAISVANVEIPASYFGKTISVFVHVERNNPNDVSFKVGSSSTLPTVLTLDDSYSMNPKAHEGLLSNKQLYKVVVGGGGGTEMTVTMKEIQYEATVYLGTNSIPTPQSFTEQADDDLGFNEKCAEACLFM
mgnify:CR=1 FL=1